MQTNSIIKGALLLSCLFAAPNSHGLDLNKLKEQLQNKVKQKQNQQQTAATPGQPAAAPGMGPSLVCDSSAKMKLCYAFSGPENAQDKNRKGNEMACKLMRGQFLPSATCPSQNAMGRCRVLAGQPKEYTLFYYAGGKINQGTAQSDCVNPKSSLHIQGSGEWTAM